jgi:clan AA aspartic protease
MERIKVTNAFDEERALAGELPRERIRSEEIDALVDTGATMLALPADLVERLGVRIVGYRTAQHADGRTDEVPWVAGVKIVILGRETHATALVVPAGTTALIGQLQLEELDLLVDSKSRMLKVNPASPDMPMLDLKSAA